MADFRILVVSDTVFWQCSLTNRWWIKMCTLIDIMGLWAYSIYTYNMLYECYDTIIDYIYVYIYIDCYDIMIMIHDEQHEISILLSVCIVSWHLTHHIFISRGSHWICWVRNRPWLIPVWHSGWWCLVVDLPLGKIWQLVSWDDDIPNIWKTRRSKPPTSICVLFFL